MSRPAAPGGDLVSETQTAAEYRRLHNAAHQMLNAADTAARNGDHTTEQRAQTAAGRLLDATQQTGDTR
jgi:hypothetical protein